LLTSTNFDLIRRVAAGTRSRRRSPPGENEITSNIEYGGLFPFNVAELQGKVAIPPVDTSRRR